ncbi:MAG TPA: nitroreductase [Acidimicrobiaceae bacterium]|nr:nitroreductase [Acidimicrobiaceae bacterium]|tara:strand:+ start:707 stop:1288 length:582 start_codon:yes stop_codon:yes gene_type:complete
MTRSFLADPVPTATLDRVLDSARRVPSAGNTQGFDFVVLEGAETSLYWDVTLPPERREKFRWQGLLRAPVLVTIWGDADAYLHRYGQTDKAHSGLADEVDAWVTPYWIVDSGFAAMTMQLAAINEGLGVLFFGMFEHSSALAKALGVPNERTPIGTIALGWPDHADTALGRSASMERRPLEEGTNSVVHRGRW